MKLVDERAEAAILGTLLINPASMADVEDMEPAWFAVPKYQAIAEAMVSVWRLGQAINHLSIAQELEKTGNLKRAGGAGALFELDQQNLEQPEGIVDQLARVKDFAIRRESRARLRAAEESLLDLSRPAEEIVLATSGELAALSASSVGDVKTAADFLELETNRIWDAQEGKADAAQFVPSGIKLLDDVIGGWTRGFVTIAGAQPGVGKSALTATSALAIAEGAHVALQGGPVEPEEVAVFSLEDAGGWMPRRWLADTCGLAIRQLMKKGLDTGQMEKVQTAAGDLHPILKRIHVDDRRGLKVQRVAATARQLVRRRGVRVVFVDHLLEMLDFGDTRSRDERIGEVLRVLRDLAADCNIAVVLAAHLKDPDDNRIDARFIRPKLQDFAGGRFVDRMARVALGLWFPPKPQEPKPPKEIAEPKPQEPKPPKEIAEPKLDKLDEAAKEKALAKYEREKTKSSAEYARKRLEWQEKVQRAEESLVVTALKVTEGESGFDFTLRRHRHAGLVSRTEGGKHEGELGYTPAA